MAFAGSPPKTPDAAMPQLLQISGTGADRFETPAQPQQGQPVCPPKLTLVHGQVLARRHCAHGPASGPTLCRHTLSSNSR